MHDLHIVNVDPDRCPVCEETLDIAIAGSTGAKGRPKSGDPCMCCQCGQILIVGADNRVRLMEPADEASFPENFVRWMHQQQHLIRSERHPFSKE
jgi:hypothetical protein